MKNEYEEYIKSPNATIKEKGFAWYTAIGLQQVDGLKTSKYLNETAQRNIKGDITFDEASKLINDYYIEKPDHSGQRYEEADKVSLRIAKILSDKAFSFSPIYYLGIHKQLFIDIYHHAGKIREYDISKNEWVLDGKSVMYGSSYMLKETLEYDFSVEKNYQYKNLSNDDFIKHIARFIANLWQIHVFAEGNTRTTAVFLIKYLNSLGYDVTNDILANNAWYFRNALVRANYTNKEQKIYEDTSYLELILRNLIFNEDNILMNRFLHINYKKQDIEENIQDIGDFNVNQKEYVTQLFARYEDNIFGRQEIVTITGLSTAAASAFLKKMLQKDIIESVSGFGKGKYKFKK